MSPMYSLTHDSLRQSAFGLVQTPLDFILPSSVPVVVHLVDRQSSSAFIFVGSPAPPHEGVVGADGVVPASVCPFVGLVSRLVVTVTEWGNRLFARAMRSVLSARRPTCVTQMRSESRSTIFANRGSR